MARERVQWRVAKDTKCCSESADRRPVRIRIACTLTPGLLGILRRMALDGVWVCDVAHLYQHRRELLSSIMIDNLSFYKFRTNLTYNPHLHGLINDVLINKTCTDLGINRVSYL